VANADKNWLLEGHLVDPSQKIDRPGRLLIVDGKVAAIDPTDDNIPSTAQHVDLRDHIIAPGLVDILPELGEPGREENETIASGAGAAIRGGFTSIACAANTDPPVDSPATVEFIRQKAARADSCRVFPVGCVSKDREGDELAEIGSLVDAGAIALSDSPRPISNTALLRRALEYCSMFDRPIIDRPEVPSLTRGGVMHEGLTQLVLALAPIPAEAEDLATSRDLRLLESTGGRLHLHGISTTGSVELVRRSKQRDVQVTVGVNIANLCLHDETLRSFSANLKVSPPLRSTDHLEACLEAVRDGTIDVISSGHQPKSLEKKMQELDIVPFGITSLDVCLSQLHTHLIKPGKLTWSRAIEVMSANPAKVLGIEAGSLTPGTEADVIAFNPQLTWKVTPAELASASTNTPLLHQELTGRISHAWVAGSQKL